MKIIVDAFGGDNAPLEVIKGAEMAVKELGTAIILVGDEDIIRKTANDNNIALTGMEIIHTTDVIDIHEEPSEITKGKSECSMAIGLKKLAAGDGDAFVSAGSTGALVFGSTFIVKRIKGIKRAALAPVLPTDNGYMMLVDAGANTECRAEMITQFGIMGSVYMQRVMGVYSPKVGLINIGAENTKGRELDIQAYHQLAKAPLNFYGNIEARDIPNGECDVIVSDGFTGNIVLKLYEGMGSYFGGTLKDMLMGSLAGKIAALLIMKKVKAFKKKMDYSETGGAVLMGIAKPVIKAHGSSNAKAFYNAIRQAKKCVDEHIIGEISSSLDELKRSGNAANEPKDITE